MCTDDDNNSNNNNNNKKINFVWKCLICNTFNAYSKANLDKIHMVSKSPLFCIQSCSNKSISFGVDPREIPFYIIEFCNFKLRVDEDKNEMTTIKWFKNFQNILKQKNALELSSIIFGYMNIPFYMILFGKSNPLTLYELKHILFELAIELQKAHKRTRTTSV